MPQDPNIGRHVLRIGAVVVQIAGVLVLWQSVSDPTPIGLGFLYVIPVAFCGWWYGSWSGLIAAAACLALYVAFAAGAGVDMLGLTAAGRGAAFVAAALAASKFHTRLRELESTAAELRAIRQALTPPQLPEIPGLDAAATLVPAEQHVAGDFYLLTNGPNDWSIALVGDVVGHGPQAAQLATFTRVTLVSLAAGTSDPGEILQLANRALRDRRDGSGEFVTVACVACHPQRRTLRWASAGHPVPVALPSATELEPVRYAEPLGLSSELDIVCSEMPFAGTDGIVLYSDGLCEARRHGEPFGLARMRATLQAAAQRPAAEIAASLKEAVQQFSGEPLADDVCIVVLRRREAASA